MGDWHQNLKIDYDLVTIRHNADQLVHNIVEDSLLSEFRYGSSRVKVAVSRAINRTLEHMRTDISKRIRKIYYVKKADFDGATKIKKADTSKNQVGYLKFSYRGSLPLSKFGATRGKYYVSVKVLRTERRKRIQPGGDRKIIATPKGRAAVWIAKGHVMGWTEDSKNGVPTAFFGPSFMSFFTEPGMARELDAEMNAFLAKRVAHELKWVSDEKNLTNFGRGK